MTNQTTGALLAHDQADRYRSFGAFGKPAYQSHVQLRAMLKGALTLKDPKHYLFFTSTANGRRAAKAFLERLKERTDDRDSPLAIPAFRAQLKAIHAWGTQAAQDLGAITHPTFVANGDADLMVPTANTIDLARRIPSAKLAIYKDAGHGGIFQHHESFVAEALAFLA